MRNGGRIVAIIAATSAPEIPRKLMPYDDRTVHGNRSRRGLRNGDQIQHFILFDPMVFIHKLLFHKRDDHISPPNVNALRYSVEKNSVHKADFFMKSLRQEYTAFRRIMKAFLQSIERTRSKAPGMAPKSPACGQIPRGLSCGSQFHAKQKSHSFRNDFLFWRSMTCQLLSVRDIARFYLVISVCGKKRLLRVSDNSMIAFIVSSSFNPISPNCLFFFGKTTATLPQLAAGHQCVSLVCALKRELIGDEVSRMDTPANQMLNQFHHPPG